MRNILTTVLFCLLLLAGTLTGIFLPDKEFSVKEKRKLTTFPKLSSKEIFAGDFCRSLETYLADQFPARDSWVTVSTLAERALGKKENNGVYFAKDGYLIDIHKHFPLKQLDANLDAVKRLSDAVAPDGIPVTLMLVPTAAFIHADKLPAFAPNANQRAIIDYAKNKGINVTDVADVLLKHRNEALYYKTDHHWTSLGAYYAYAEWMLSHGRDAAPLSEWTVETLYDGFRGTTYIKTGDPFAAHDTIEAVYRVPTHRVDYNNGYYIADSIYERDLLQGNNPYGVFLNSNQATTVVYGGGTGKLLIIKDSYANTFAQFPVDDFEETHLIDMRFFRGSVQNYIRVNGITEVLVLYNIPNFTEDTDAARIGR